MVIFKILSICHEFFVLFLIFYHKKNKRITIQIQIEKNYSNEFCFICLYIKETLKTIPCSSTGND